MEGAALVVQRLATTTLSLLSCTKSSIGNENGNKLPKVL